MMETFFDWANASDAHIDENPNRKIDAYNLLNYEFDILFDSEKIIQL